MARPTNAEARYVYASTTSTTRGCVAMSAMPAASRMSTVYGRRLCRSMRLEAAEPDRADHQRGRDEHHRQRRQRRPIVGQTVRDRRRPSRPESPPPPGSACRRSTACRRPCALWMLKRASRIAAAVTNRNPAAQPRRPSGWQSPRERQNRRRDAERDHVGQRVELDAEVARRAGQPRDAAVEHVEHDGEADERRGRLELAAHRVDDARVAAEHVAQREQAGQQVDTAPEPPPRPVGRAPQESQAPGQH